MIDGNRKSVLSYLPDALSDVTFFSALGSITYGAWLVYRPAGYIVGGIIAAACVIVYERMRPR